MAESSGLMQKRVIACSPRKALSGPRHLPSIARTKRCSVKNQRIKQQTTTRCSLHRGGMATGSWRQDQPSTRTRNFLHGSLNTLTAPPPRWRIHSQIACHQKRRSRKPEQNSARNNQMHQMHPSMERKSNAESSKGELAETPNQLIIGSVARSLKCNNLIQLHHHLLMTAGPRGTQGHVMSICRMSTSRMLQTSRLPMSRLLFPQQCLDRLSLAHRNHGPLLVQESQVTTHRRPSTPRMLFASKPFPCHRTRSQNQCKFRTT